MAEQGLAAGLHCGHISRVEVVAGTLKMSRVPGQVPSIVASISSVGE